jgi:Phytanoyl-CoA dioxygenase (PhyH)
MQHAGLKTEEVERFLTEGYAVVRSAFSAELARECRRSAARQLHIDLVNPETWTTPVVRGIPTGDCFRDAAGSPQLKGAIGSLVNPDTWQDRPNLGAFAVRFPSETDPGDAGWHIDSSFQPPGDPRWFVNYRSKHRALLLLCLLSDVGIDDAPTRLLPGSHLEMARLLVAAGEEGLPGAYQGQESKIPLPERTTGAIQATGSAGDVFLCHPFLVHAASWPHRGHQPRFVAQPPIALTDSLELRGPAERLSLVARAIRIGIGELRHRAH